MLSKIRLQKLAYCCQPAGSPFSKVLCQKWLVWFYFSQVYCSPPSLVILPVTALCFVSAVILCPFFPFEKFRLLVLTEGAACWYSVWCSCVVVLRTQEGLMWCVNDKLSAQVLPHEVLVMESGELSELGKAYIPPRILLEALCVISSVAGLDVDSFEPENLALEMLLLSHHPSLGKWRG